MSTEPTVIPTGVMDTHLQIFGELLDGLDIAMCVFNQDDQALFWNRHFLQYFPEHEGHVHVGEHYSSNLRRFYTTRLSSAELVQIDEYIAAGIARHQSQSRPYEFEQRGLNMRVSSLVLGGVGRVRLWRAEPIDHVDTATSDGAILPHADGHLSLLNQVPDSLMISGADGKIAWVNDPFVVMYGLLSRESDLGATFEQIYRTVWDQADRSQDENFKAGLQTLQESMMFSGAPFELPLPGQRYCRVIAKSMNAGQSLYAHVDITEIKRQQNRLTLAERAARESEAQLKRKSVLLEATLANMTQGVLMIGADGTVDVINRRALDLLGLPMTWWSNEPKRHCLLDPALSGIDLLTKNESIRSYIADGTISDALLLPYEHRTKDARVLEVHSALVQGGGLLCTFLDITQRKLDDDRIRYAANHDSLTGLLNRAMFIERLNAEVLRSQQAGAGCAVLYVDLDGFKAINDHHGHAMGDRVLVWVAKAIQRVAREADFVARFGGDEFVVLLREIHHREQAQSLADRLAQALGAPITLDEKILKIGASVGIALCPGDATDSDSLLKHADTEMYANKAQRRPEAI
jgi:diguanylate cyclase (GGDEF)-like protein